MNLEMLHTWLRARLHTTFDERGANLVEYMLLVAFIVVLVVVGVRVIGGTVSTKYSSNNSALQ